MKKNSYSEFKGKRRKSKSSYSEFVENISMFQN